MEEEESVVKEGRKGEKEAGPQSAKGLQSEEKGGLRSEEGMQSVEEVKSAGEVKSEEHQEGEAVMERTRNRR